MVVLAFCYFFFPDPTVWLGVLAGAGFAIPNYVLWIKLVAAITQPGFLHKKRTLFILLGLKMLLLVVVLGGSFMILQVHAMGFVAGFMCPIFVALLQSLAASLFAKN